MKKSLKKVLCSVLAVVLVAGLFVNSSLAFYGPTKTVKSTGYTTFTCKSGSGLTYALGKKSTLYIENTGNNAANIYVYSNGTYYYKGTVNAHAKGTMTMSGSNKTASIKFRTNSGSTNIFMYTYDGSVS